VRGGELIREARLRAGLTQTECRSTRAQTKSCARRCWRRRASESSGCSPNSGRSVLGRGAEGKIVAGRASAVFDPYELLGALQSRSVSFVVIGAFARVVPAPAS